MRRPLTDDELARLLAVAEPRGRKPWYLAAVLAGLRKGDLQRLCWCDIDFEANTITIKDGKAKRVDVLPMHPQLAAELSRLRDKAMAMPKAHVFPQTVTNETRLKDFLKAGLAREEIVTDANGEPVMIGKGKQRRVKTRIVTEDDEGRVVDLHAMRTTLGTNLARAGVAPQLAQRIMRHADYRTTQQHYTVLGVADTAKAIGQLPTIAETPATRAAATGTCDSKNNDLPQNSAQQYCQQLGRENMRNGATGCQSRHSVTPSGDRCIALETGGLSEKMRGGAEGSGDSGRSESNRHDQLGRLGLYH